MKTNKNGVKLLAAVAVFAMVFAGAAVMIDNDSDATDTTSYPGGPFIFKTNEGNGAYTGYNKINNKDLGNNMSVSYDADTKTYYITGTIAKVGTLSEIKSAGTATQANTTSLLYQYWQMWGVDNLPLNAFYFGVGAQANKDLVWVNPYYEPNADGTKRLSHESIASGTDMLAGVPTASYDLTFWIAPTTSVSDMTTDAEWNEYMATAEGVETYHISLNVTVSDEKNAGNGYVAIENGNALVASSITSGTDGADGKWALNETTLTLTNYNGKEYFDGSFTEVVLVGDNTITLKNQANALKSSAGFTIKSVDGVGSLTIDMENDLASLTGWNAIESSDKVTINGVSVNIKMTEKYVTEPTTVAGWKSTNAIKSNGFEIYAGNLDIEAGTDNFYSAFGIYSVVSGVGNGDITIRSSDVNINAGSRGMDIKGAASISIAASTVSIEADQLGIRTGTNSNAKLSITNESKVDVNVYGNAEGYYKPYGVSVSGSIEVQSDSVLTTDGLILYGNNSASPSVNNATIINEGEMVVWNTATFDNKGKFVNNGTVGIYGNFTNSAGETINNGTMSTFGMLRTDATYKNQTLVASYKDSSDAAKTLTVKIKSMMPQADGTFLATIEAKDNSATPVTKEYVGTITYTFDASGVSAYSIDAVNKDGSIQVDYNKDGKVKYSVFASEFDGCSVTSEDAAASGKPVTADTLGSTNAITNNAPATISVTGGKVTNEKTFNVNKDCTSTKFIDGGEIINNGDLAINASVTMGKGKLSGNDAIVGANVTITLKGDVEMAFSHSSEYTTTAPGSTTSTTTKFTDVVEVNGKVNDVSINTTPNTRMNGFVAISGMDNTDKTGDATVTVKEGSASITGAIGNKMVLSVATGTTLQVASTGANALNGVIAVQDGATFNMKVASDRNTASFGTLTYTISFANEGYTYYGSLQYALANAAEGATLELNGTADITETTAVKAGITLNFKENAALNITGTDDKKVVFTMGEGAKFVLAKGTTVAIGKDYVTTSGTFEYDGNVVILDKVVFNNSNATITPVLKTNTVASSISVNMDAVDGKITADKGIVTGTVKVNKTTEGTGASEKLKTTSAFIVSKDATADLATFNDNIYAKTVVDGTLKFAANKTIMGTVEGDGAIVLKDGISVKFQDRAKVTILVGNGTDAFDMDNVNVTPVNSSGVYNGDGTKKFTVTAIAKSGNNAAYMTISGEVLGGTITSVRNTAFGTAATIFTLGSKATVEVPADATLTINKMGTDAAGSQNTVNGLLKVAGKINMKVENVADSNVYGTLNYQITYTDGSYTVYTMLSTGVSNANAGDSFTISEDLTISENMEVPSGVTIIIAEGKTLNVDAGKYIEIGTPITTLGVTGGVQGTIKLGSGSFVIVYADDSVDMSKAVIKDAGDQKAKNSQYTVLNEVYATVYVDITAPVTAATVKTNVENVLVPEIDGYRFLGWDPIVTGGAIGSTDFEGNMKAAQVQVVFKQVDGITYYVDNHKMNTVGAPVYVAYGATVTAVADYGYTGTALVNGKEYITIDSTTTEIVGSGVTAGSSAGSSDNGGMGITDILLIVLVILAAILVVIVALRMMRS